MTPEGNLVQIPSSIVYKNNLLNFTSSVSRHEHLALLQDLERSVRQRTDTASAEGHIWIQVR